MKTFRKWLAVFLTLTLFVAGIQIPSIVEAYNADTDIVMQAETDAVSNMYGLSGDRLGGLGSLDWGAVKACDLSEGKKVNKSVLPYVAYNVKAPAEGDYEIKVGWVADVTKCADYKMTIKVNDGVVYKLQEAGIGTSGAYETPITVHLNVGNNVIYCIPYVAENVEYKNDTWVDMDYLAFARNTGLEAVKPSTLELKPSYASFINMYNTKNADGSLGGRWGTEGAILDDGITAPEKLGQVPHFSYTVSVPSDGYYDISLKYNTDEGTAKTGCFGFLVDGVLNKVAVDWCKWDSYNYKIANASIYLTAGVHSLTFTERLKETESDGWSWTDFIMLTVYGGVIRADYQMSPTGEMSRMETELDASKVSEIYGNKNAAEAGYSGYGQVGGMQGFDTANLQTETDLKDSLNKNVPYMQYIVTAPADGDYTLKPVYYVNIDTSHPYAGATIKVNGNGVYFAAYNSSTSGTADTAVTVALKKGRNVITVLPFNATQKDYVFGLNQWINQDYLGIDSRLVGVKDTTEDISVNAGRAQYYGNCSPSGTQMKNSNSWNAARIMATAEGLTRENFSKYIWYSFTVTAPQAGYYEISESLGTKGGFNYFGCLANGTSYVGKQINGSLCFYPYLEKGDNVICFTGEVPRDSAQIDSLVGVGKEGYNSSTNYYTKLFDLYAGNTWTDFNSVSLTGGVTLAETQVHPGHSYTRIQAEDTAKAFIHENGRFSVDGDHIGDGNFYEVQDIGSLGTYLDKEKTPYVAVVVDAPTDGTYAVKACLQKSIPNIDNIYRAYGNVPQMAFIANGDCIVQTAYSGGDGEKSESEALVSLKEGRNVIYCLPVTKEETDLIQTDIYGTGNTNNPGSIWANVDYLDVDSALSVVDVSSVSLNAGDAEFVNLYEKNTDGSLGGGNYGAMEAEALTISDLSRRSIAKVPYFSYTVTAPKNGYYDITVKGGFAGNYDTYGMMVDKTAYAKKASNGAADFSVYLTEGDHVLVFTAVMPKDGTLDYQPGTWTNYSSVTLHGGLKKAAKQQNPGIHFDERPMEAESDAIVSAYADKNLTVAGVSGTLVGNATGKKLKPSEMRNGPAFNLNSYVAYAVYAPVADQYDLAICMQIGNEGNDNTAYDAWKMDYNNGKPLSFRIIINDTVETVSFPAEATMGDRVQVTIPALSLKEGINIIYCMDLDSITAQNLKGAYVNYDCLLIQDELSAVASENLTIPGDVNADQDINSVDLIHFLKHQKAGTTVKKPEAVDFDSNGSIDESAHEELIQILLGNPGMNSKCLKKVVINNGVTAYSTVLQYANADTLTSCNVGDSTAAVRVKDGGNAETGSVNINVDTTTVYQTMDGFGASITDSSAINLYKMEEGARTEVMNALFSADGLGLTYLRQPLGASDFVENLYTYCDSQGSWLNPLKNFSIAHDEEKIIPLIQQAQQIVKDSGNSLHVFATPWTAPLWMKEENDWNTIDDAGNSIQNRLKSRYEDTYAEYLAKAIQAYKGHGIEIEAMTIQNETDACHDIPSMFLDANQNKSLAPKVKSALQKAGLNTKIFAYDFNWFGEGNVQSGVDRVKSFMNAIDYAGIAFHPYQGDPQVQKNLYDEYKDTKKIYVTEAAGSIHADNFFHQMIRATESLNAGASAYIGWNVMLDENRGPAVTNPIGIGITTLNNDGTWTKNPDYYAFAHFSKFIKPGAQIVKSEMEGSSIDISYTAAKNTDGSVVVVVSNSGYSVETVNIKIGGKVISQKLSGKSAVTYVVK